MTTINDSIPNPGVCLQKARESLQLTPNDIAKQLKLKVQWVIDAENNAFESHIPPAYIRGYLSAYARLVGLSPEMIVTGFDALHPEAFDSPLEKVHANMPYHAFPRNKSTWVWRISLVSIVMIGIAVFFAFKSWTR